MIGKVSSQRVRGWRKVIIALVLVGAVQGAFAQAPTVQIVSPTAGATIGGSQVAVTVSFSANSGGITNLALYIDSTDSTPVAVQSFSPPQSVGSHTFLWDSSTVPNGTHTLIVQAVGFANKALQIGQGQVTVQVNNPPPTVQIQEPVNGQPLQGIATFQVTGQFATTAPCDKPIKAVRLKIDGQVVAKQNLDPPATQGSFSFPVTMYRYPNGSHTLTVEVQDNRQVYGYYYPYEGWMDPSVGQASVTVTFFTPPPQVQWVNLSDGQMVSGKTFVKVSFQKVAPNPGGVRVVQLFVDETLHDERRTEWADEEQPTNGEVELVLDAGRLTEGSHVLVVKAKDVYGHSGESTPLTVQVVRQPALVRILSPAPNSRVGGTQVKTIVQFESREQLPVLRVRLAVNNPSSEYPWYPLIVAQKDFVANDYLKTGPTAGEVTFVWNATTFSNGSYTLTAYVEEDRGSSSSSEDNYYGMNLGTPSDPLPITIDNTTQAPTVSALRVRGVGPDYALLEWEPAEASNFSRYEVHISTQSGFTPTEGTLKASLTERYQVRWKVTGLTPATTYFARLRLYDPTGAFNDSNEVSFTTLSTTALFDDPPAETEIVLERRIYDEAGRLAAVLDGNGNGTFYTYDADGRMVKVKDALGNETIFTYDAAGRQIATVNPLGVRDEFVYDAAGRKVQERKGTNTPTPAVTTYAYDAAGQVTAVTDPLGNTTRYDYDAKGRLVKVTDPLGNEWQYAYDAVGNKVREVPPTGRVIEYRYDAANQLVQVVVDAGGLNLTTTYAYDEVGNKVSETDPKGRTTYFAYNEHNRLVQVIDPQNGPSKPTVYEYDGVGNRVKVMDPEGREVRYRYDMLGRLIRLVRGDGTEERYAYDAAGNRIAKRKGDGTIIRYEYDALNRLVRRVYPDGKEHRFEYDPLGRLVKVSDEVGEIRWQYDALGRVISITQPVGATSKTLTYAYDGAGNRIQMVDGEGVVTNYTYDAAGRLVQVSNGIIGTVKFFYDGEGKLIRQENGNGVYATFTYDGAGRVTQIEYRRMSDNSLLSRFVYTYDAAGNRAQVQEQVLQPDGSWASGAVTYGYDAIDRLTMEKRDGSYGYWYEYTYDGSGNRLTMVQKDSIGNVIGQKSYTYDGGNKLLQEVANGVTISYAYDVNGNLTAKSTGASVVRYYWDAEDKMVRLEDSVVMNFKTDALGFRRFKEVVGQGQTWFVYDLGESETPGLAPLIAEYDANGNLVAKYHHDGGGLLAMSRGNANYWYAYETIGTTRQLTNSQTQVTDSYAFDAWGNELAAQGSTFNPYRYVGKQGYYLDTESALMLLGVRYYDASTGRLASLDPIHSEINWYTYANLNPLIMIDPEGMLSWALICGGVVLVVIGGGAAYTYISCDLARGEAISYVRNRYQCQWPQRRGYEVWCNDIFLHCLTSCILRSRPLGRWLVWACTWRDDEEEQQADSWGVQCAEAGANTKESCDQCCQQQYSPTERGVLW